MTDIITPLTSLKSELQNVIDQTEPALVNPPEGHLRISNYQGRTSYYHLLPADQRQLTEDAVITAPAQSRDTSRNGKYIRKGDFPFVQSLAQKDYDTHVIKIAQAELQRIDDLLEHYEPKQLEEAYASLHPLRRELITPRVLTDELFAEKWQNITYSRKGFDPKDTSDFFTEKGERVRSKSEMLLANHFLSRGIPYHYEYPLHLFNRSLTYHPDFTLLNSRTRKTYFWEHLGRMDNEDYAVNAMTRINNYVRNGIIPGRDLIFTHETNKESLSMSIIDIYIDTFLI